MKMTKKLTALFLIFCALTAYAQRSEEEIIAEIYADMAANVGKMAPSFSLNNPKGELVTLESLKGHWVILDFWGSWCRFCVADIPKLKRFYEQYHPEGLEIIGIDCGETEEAWKAAIERYAIPWTNVYNPGKRNSGVCEEYAVRAYPSKILIDPDGIIKNVYLDDDEELFEFLRLIYDQK